AMSPGEAEASRATGWFCCTEAGRVNCGTGARAVNPAPVTASVEESEPPELEVTRTKAGGALSGGAVALGKTVAALGPVSGPKPSTVSTGAFAALSVLLEFAVTVRSPVSALYAAAVTLTWSTRVAVLVAI